MRIIECIHSLKTGGAERLLVDLSNALNETDEVVVLTLWNHPERKDDFYVPKLSKGIRFVSLNFSEGFHPSYLLKVYLTIKSLHPDIVHIHCIIHYFLLSILFYRKCRYVQTLHNEVEHDIMPYFWRVWKWLLETRLLHLVTISSSNRASFRKRSHLTCDTLIYNGRKQLGKSKKFDVTASFITSLKKHSDDTLLLSVARSSLQKNIGMLVTIVNELVNKGEHIQLILIGNHDATVHGLQWMASAGPAVHFIGVKDNVGDYFLLCDAFCLSSFYEGMPITLIEALACQCVPVCTPCSGVVDVVENGFTGFISKSFLKDDYERTIIDFLQNKERIDKDNLYNKYLSLFSIESCCSQYRKLFLTLFESLSSHKRNNNGIPSKNHS